MKKGLLKLIVMVLLTAFGTVSLNAQSGIQDWGDSDYRKEPRNFESTVLSDIVASDTALTPLSPRTKGWWVLKSNMVYDLLLMPSLELEYCFNDSWSIALEGNVAWWKIDRKHKYYQLATVIPEFRKWFRGDDMRRGHYVGVFCGSGLYDLENGGEGYKGEGWMAGLSYGYQFPIGKSLSLEAGLGVGFMTTEYEDYLPLDGHYVYQYTKRTNYIGPLRLKFALVWHIGF